MAKLILMRHGQSLWNERNLFTGWVDVGLSKKGIDEALSGGEKIKHIPIDVVYTSSLIRAQMTTMLALSVHSSKKVPLVCHPGGSQLDQWSTIHNQAALADCIPVYNAWQLNERMYGELQGLNKAETMAKFGVDQVKIWRRSFDVAPPGGESLEMTAARTLPYFRETILPHLANDQTVFISAHGNSLRAIVMHIENIAPEQIIHFEIATGEPLCYEYRGSTFTKESHG